jgi:hypothetical protein
VLSSTPIWIYRRGATAELRPDKNRYRVGEPIEVAFANAPGMALDWVSLYRCADDGCGEPTSYLVYGYTSNAIEGSVIIGPESLSGTESWPLPAGRYVARLLVDDGYRFVAESRVFSIR